MRATFSILKWIVLVLFAFIASSNMYMEGGFFLSLFIGVLGTFFPSIFGRGALGANAKNVSKCARRRIAAIVFSIISLVTASMMTIIMAISEVNGGSAIALSVAIVDILVLIFMKVVDKKNYIYIPDYLRY